jgi:anti-repressor protein
MNELKIFEKAEFGSVRVVMKDGEPWFVAKDVCKVLELENVGQALSCLDDDEKSSIDPNIITADVGFDALMQKAHLPMHTVIPEAGRGGRPLSLISEAGLYSLILRSRKPEAKEIRRWVTHDILPSIRRTGGYLLDKPDDTPESIMARAVLIAQDTIKRLESRNTEFEGAVNEMKPKALFADSVASSSSSILAGQLTALIRQNGVDIGQNRLFGWLREHGWLISSGSRRNSPTQKGLDMGLFEVKERAINNPDGSVRLTLTTKVTGRGQIYFVNRFVGADTPC